MTLRRPAWLLMPAVLLHAVLFALPICLVLLLSFGYPKGFTLANYLRVVTAPVYALVLVNTFRIALMVTVACLVLGYPVAYWLTLLPPERARLAMALVIVPFWSSVLVRNYAWMVVLGNNGLVNNLLKALGLIHAPLPLLYNRFGVVVGMTHVQLPFMILSLYGVMQGIDRRLLQAASSLGASPWRSFLQVYLPLSLPAVAAGSLLVMVSSFGFFITPALLGGRNGIMVSMVIENLINQVVEWGLGSALTLVLLAVTSVLLVLYSRFTRADKLWGAVR